MRAVILRATPSTKALGCESGGHEQSKGGEGRKKETMVEMREGRVLWKIPRGDRDGVVICASYNLLSRQRGPIVGYYYF